MCGPFRSLALHPGVQVHGVQGSLQAAPRLIHQPVRKKAPTTPAPNLGPGPGRNLGPTLIVVHAGTTADHVPAQGPTTANRVAGPTVENVDAGAIAARPCPIAAGTLATVQIQTRMPAWECLG